jgi:hypothetical protein
LGQQEPSNNRNAGRSTCFTAWPDAKSYRNCAKQGRRPRRTTKFLNRVLPLTLTKNHQVEMGVWPDKGGFRHSYRNIMGGFRGAEVIDAHHQNTQQGEASQHIDARDPLSQCRRLFEGG